MKSCEESICNFYEATTFTLESIFEKICEDVGLNQDTGVKTALLLNFDFSEKMQGRNWDRLIEHLEILLGKLRLGDLVSCILFNDRVRLLEELSPRLVSRNTTPAG